ncbi:MAG: DUF87 domain-containing protein [Nitrososphaerota archaeon]
MMWLYQIGIAVLIFVLGVTLSGRVGAGLWGILVFAGVAVAAVLLIRRADSLSLGRGTYPASSFYGTALRRVRSVNHMGDVDLLELSGNHYVAVSAVRVIDVRDTVDGSDPSRLFALVSQLGEVISSLGGVEVKVVVAKPPFDGKGGGPEPLFKFYLVAESESRRVSSLVSEAARSLAERLGALGIDAEVCSCGRGSCGITGLRTVGGVRPLPVTRLPGFSMLLGSAVPFLTSAILAPNVFGFVAPLSLMLAAAGWMVLRVSGSISSPSPVTPLEGEVTYENGRLRIGGTYYSFLTLRRIEHSDRFVDPEDVVRLLSTMNSSFLYQRYGYIAMLSVRRIDEAIYARKESFKMDMSYWDYETGGGLSRALKARRHQTKLERMRMGEKPYEVSGVFVVRTVADDLEAVKVSEEAFRSSLSLLGFSASFVRNPRGIMRCIRSLYLPVEGVVVPVLEPADVVDMRALTLDFSWFSPFARDRIPLMVREGVWLGHDHRGRRIYWNPRAVRNAHMAVFGPMGSGKSTLVKTLILRSSEYFERVQGRRPLYVIVDPAGEYQKIAEELNGEIINMLDRKVNPLLLEGTSPIERAKFVAEMMRYLKGLKGEEVSALKECILEAYSRVGIDPNDPRSWLEGRDRAVTMREVYSIVAERLKASAGKPMEPVYRSLADKLLDVAEGARAFNRTDLTVDELMRKGGVLCLSFKDEFGVMSDDLQRVVVWTLLQQVRDRLLSLNVEEDVRVVVAIDEAHRFVSVGKLVEGGVLVNVEPPLSLHLRDTRKFGAAYILITHKPEDMPQGTVELVGTTIALSHPNNAYAEWAAQYLGLTESQKRALMSAGIGAGFLITTEDPRPLFIRVVPEKAALVRDAVADRLRALGMAPAERKAQESVPEREVGQAKERVPARKPVVVETDRRVIEAPAGAAPAQGPPAAPRTVIEEDVHTPVLSSPRCFACGAALVPGARFCHICASPVYPGPHHPVARMSSPRPRLVSVQEQVKEQRPAADVPREEKPGRIEVPAFQANGGTRISYRCASCNYTSPESFDSCPRCGFPFVLREEVTVG